MTPTEHQIRKLAATAAAEQATVIVCAGLLRAALPQSPAARKAVLHQLQLDLERSRAQDLHLPVPGLAEVEQHLADDLYREALEEAHQHLMAELRK